MLSNGSANMKHSEAIIPYPFKIVNKFHEVFSVTCVVANSGYEMFENCSLHFINTYSIWGHYHLHVILYLLLHLPYETLAYAQFQ